MEVDPLERRKVSALAPIREQPEGLLSQIRTVKRSAYTHPCSTKLTIRSTTSLPKSDVVVLVPQLIPSKLAWPGLRHELTVRFVTNLIASNLELHALSQGRPARVVTAMTMLKQYLFR